MRRRTRRKTAPVPELLEARTLLTGHAIHSDVTAVIDDAGNLQINGDEGDNYVYIKQDSGHDHGHYGGSTVWIWGEETSINGQSYDMDNPLGLEGFTGGINASLGDGNDDFYSYGVHTTGDMTIEMGSGLNEAWVDRTIVDGSFSLLGGPRKDEFYLDNVEVGRMLLARGYGGKDGIYVSRTESRNLYLNTGRGNDDLYVYDVEASGTGYLRGGRGSDYLGQEANYSSVAALGEDHATSFEDFGVARPNNVMDQKLDDAIDILERGRAGQNQHEQAIDQIMEALFVSNVVPLPTNTNGNDNDPDEQDFDDFQEDMDRAIEALRKHVNASTKGTDETKADAQDARNFLQLTQEALQAIAGQTAFCDPGNGTNLQGIGCDFLEADDEGGARIDDVLDGIFSRQLRSPFPIFTNASLTPDEVVINTGPLADGECSGTIKEFFGIKAVVTARTLPVWVEPWFARARIVGSKTVFALEFVPAEYIKTIQVCNDSGSLQTDVSAVTVHDRGLMHFWRFIKHD